MHKFKRSPISIDDNLDSVRKGLHIDQRTFFDTEKANLKSAFLNYDLHSTTNPVSLENLHPIWAEDIADSPIQKKSKKEKQDRAFNLYGSNRSFVNKHWEALKNANGSEVLMCPICGLEVCSEMDHYLPRSIFHEFSSHTNNLIPLCHDCNQDKHDYWLNSKGERYFFNAFFDQLPANIITCSIKIMNGFPHAEISISNKLNEADYYDSIVLRTFNKLKLLKKMQMKADMFMRSETQRLISDYSRQRDVYHNDRAKFWKSRISSYQEYINHPQSFCFIDVEIYKAMISSKEIKDWVEHGKNFTS